MSAAVQHRVAAQVRALIAMAEALHEHPGVEVTLWDCDREAMSAAALDELEQELGLRLTPAVRAFWSTVYWYRLEWRERTPEGADLDPLFGSITIEGPHHVLGGPQGEGWKGVFWSEDTAPDAVPNLAGIRPFDMFYPDDRGCTCLSFDEGAASETLSLYQVGLGATAVHDLGIGLERYLELLLATRGAAGFQYMIRPTPLAFDHAASRERLRAAVLRLFPDADLSWMR